MVKYMDKRLSYFGNPTKCNIDSLCLPCMYTHMLVIKDSDCEIHLVTIKSAIHFEEIIGQNKFQRHHSGEIGDKSFSIISLQRPRLHANLGRRGGKLPFCKPSDQLLYDEERQNV